MTSKSRTASLGIGLLGAALLATGCQSHVGTAANVGSARISTQTLNSAYVAALRTASGKKQGAALEGQVLTELVQDQLVNQLAASQHVAVPQIDIDSALAKLKAAQPATDGDQTDSQQREATSLAAINALGTYYAKKTGKVDAVHLTAIPVDTPAIAQTVVAALTKTPDDVAAITSKYSNSDQIKALGGDVGVQLLSGLGDAEATVAKLKVGQPAVVPISGMTYVLRVEAQVNEAAVRDGLAQVAKVKVNPRFGSWDGAKAVVGPAVSDVVSPTPGPTVPPSGAPSAAPSAGS